MATVTNHTPATADRTVQSEDPLGIEEAFPEILRITEELFGGTASVVIEEDPELPDVRYAVFETAARGDSAELVRLRLQWHERVEMVIGGDQSEKVCLSLDIDE
ncbi:MAG TPA: hypothetical protein VML55_04615 [Planctomycetaceae bacterium]|nr:hypothetical protein [Planctomycetaceae bacterium]